MPYFHIMNVLAEFKRVTTFIFDIDGVFTDSSVFCSKMGYRQEE